MHLRVKSVMHPLNFIYDMPIPTLENLKNLLITDRSIRRYDTGRKVTEQTLIEVLSLLRYCHSGRNLQPLAYCVVQEKDECDKLFPTLKWAGYFKDWEGPAIDERPTAYLIQCLDTRLTTNPMCDEGLQLQTLTLGFASLGLGTCIIKAFNKAYVAELLHIPEHYDVRYVLAIGYPSEKVEIVDMQDDNVVYYRDANDTHCVPKRQLKEMIIPR